MRESALALALSRLLIWAVAVPAYLLLDLSPEVRFDHGGLTQSFGDVGNALAAPAVRWDSNWYFDIADHGYRHQTERAFFPLYPLLMRTGGLVTGSTVVAGLVISIACFFAALVLLHRLCALEVGQDAAHRSVYLLAFFPTALFFSALYTESLFLALELGAFYAARRERWAWAGVLGMLGSATRNTGFVLAPVLLVLYLYGPRGDREPRPRTGLRPRYRLGASAAWIALVPIGLLAYLAYSAADAGDWLAPMTAARENFQRSFDGPLSGLWQGAELAWNSLTGLIDGSGRSFGAFNKVALFGTAAAAVAATVDLLRRLPLAYGIYVAASLLIILSFPHPLGPLASSLRYIAVLFPLFLWLGLRLRDPRAYRAVLAIFALGLAYGAANFATWNFVA